MRRAGRGREPGEGRVRHRTGAGVEDEAGNVLASEVNDVLGRSFEFQHLMVSSGFRPRVSSGLES